MQKAPIADRYMQLGQRSQSASSLDQAFQMAKTVPGNESQLVTIYLGNDRDPYSTEDEQDRGSFFEAIALKYAQIVKNNNLCKSLKPCKIRSAVML